MSNRKNVLLISTDHWSAPLMGCAGHPTVMTPTLDQLAADGIRFTNCFSTCPVCIPARRSLMTGMTPASHGDRVYSDRMPMPPVTTLAQAFRNAGYQAFAVGKLHVYPQRDRIGFDDVVLMEEGRYDFGNVDDYQIWLGENGFTGREFLHGMGNNSYLTRPWHLPEEAHPTTWATYQMMRQMKRKDPTRPALWYMSYQFPHPPLVPLQTFLDFYAPEEVDMPEGGEDWLDDATILHLLREQADPYTEKDIRRARRAFYALCTHIDYEIRNLIGTLRESDLLKDTVIVFLSDHGDTLFEHGICGKRTFYQGSTNIPLLISGEPVQAWRGQVSDRLACLEDVMPTLLALCGIEIPETVEGIDLLHDSRELLYGEIGEGKKATRMATDGRHKLIYYPCGNVLQLFDIQNDPKEKHDLSRLPEYAGVRERLTGYLVEHLHGDDLNWLKDGRLIGFEAGPYAPAPDYGLYNQRGLHWPTPGGYANCGKT
ncbi:MAG: sulfatase-like hydrolase/transferase [Clostridia bacterium]|nr:sulfatase-like hydrolase/transferase [Clostridia bacterium]